MTRRLQAAVILGAVVALFGGCNNGGDRKDPDLLVAGAARDGTPWQLRVNDTNVCFADAGKTPSCGIGVGTPSDNDPITSVKATFGEGRVFSIGAVRDGVDGVRVAERDAISYPPVARSGRGLGYFVYEHLESGGQPVREVPIVIEPLGT